MNTVKRVPQIDGLRAIAIMLVVSFHYINNQLINSRLYLGKLSAKLFSFGWAGVDLFFVLSGFLIGGILISNKNKQNYFSTFYIRRFLRIIPNYYLLVIIFVLICSAPLFWGKSYLASNTVLPLWSYFTMLQNLFMAKLNNMGNAAMSVTWSIAIEEQFYLIMPLIIYFTNTKILPYLLIIFIVAAIFFRSIYSVAGVSFNIPAYVLLPCRMDAISFGVLLAWINVEYGIENFVSKHYKTLLGLLLFSAITCITLFTIYQDIGIIRNTLFALFFTCCIAIALGKSNSIYSQLLTNKTLNWIGKISYSLYLFHYLILRSTKVVFAKSHNLQNPLWLFTASVTALIVSIFFSWLVYKFLESPIVAFGKKFNYQ